MSWFFDPGVGNDLQPSFYVNLTHTFNNGLMAVETVILYGYLAYFTLKKSGASGDQKLSKYQINILLQAFFFCIFHFIGSILYVYMQFVSAPEYLIIISQLGWQFGTGSVCVVYLTLNRSIRKSVSKHLCPKCLKKTNQVSVIASLDSRAYELSHVQIN
ncbi:hypothetical protein GCK72_020231 [Caenorhabditis remanei]|uniref:Serpentine receptor class gamma n=1 Tax=Caenorhabditis remanei TaxID=31234 RepID=A0A6A5GFZ0_CAERE|nr:hypothetical protein GCK72_020231 [Caenorhabditis remanei]KAF1753674.1 hypothetical protein GCK72_020231 [Caenorhabditis remanei]